MNHFHRAKFVVLMFGCLQNCQPVSSKADEVEGDVGTEKDDAKEREKEGRPVKPPMPPVKSGANGEEQREEEKADKKRMKPEGEEEEIDGPAKSEEEGGGDKNKERDEEGT